MNQYLTYFAATQGNRDLIYQYFLNILGKRPALLLEVGCARNLELATRLSDGWSSVFFAQYVQAYGGKHIVVDVSKESLDNCRKILGGIDSKTTLLQMTGAEALKLYMPDAVLLDGSDDPAEMVTEMNLIKAGTPVLCDDFHTKGAAIAKLRNDYLLFGYEKHAHRMAIFNSGVPAHSICLPAL